MAVPDLTIGCDLSAIHSYVAGPSTMKNRGSRWAKLERATRREARPPEGSRPPGGTETVTSTCGTAPPARTFIPATARRRPTAMRTAASGRLSVGNRMAPPPHPQRDHEERCPVDDIALEHSVGHKQDQGGEDPEGELESVEVYMIRENENREQTDLGDHEEVPPREHVSVGGEGRQPETGRGLKRGEGREHRRRPGRRIPGDERSVHQKEDARCDAAEGGQRLAHIAPVPMPIPEEEEGRQEPRGLLERARDAVPQAGPGRPSEVRGHEEAGDDPEDGGNAPRCVLHELERHHEADRSDAAERRRGAQVQDPESGQV